MFSRQNLSFSLPSCMLIARQRKTYASNMKCLLFILISCFHSAVFALDELVLWDKNFDQGNSAQIISLIAEATVEEFGPYTLNRSAPLEQGRAVEELSRGRNLNIAIMGNDAGREELLDPIYIPVDKGELGMRICLIKKGSQEKFVDLKNAQQTRQKDIVFGLGSFWPDTPIHSANGFNVYSTPVFESLFRALAKGRFDCMSRSISEISADYHRHKDLAIEVEQKLAFVYPLANFVYLPKDSYLRPRIEAGLRHLLEQGTLERVNNEYLQEHLTELSFFTRKLIILENPNLTLSARSAINEHGLISFEQAKVQRLSNN